MTRFFFVFSLFIFNIFNSFAKDGTYCVIDMGSKSIKLSITQLDGRTLIRKFPTLTSETSTYKRELNVGSDIDANHNRISEEKLVAINDILSSFKATCANEPYSLTEFHAVATAAFRDADEYSQNRVKEIAQAQGILLSILPKEKEALYGYLGSTGGASNAVSLDIGSRSFQVSSRFANDEFIGKSFNLGYMFSYDHFYKDQPDFALAKAAHVQAMKDGIQDELIFVRPTMVAFLLGGTSPEYLVSLLLNLTVKDAKQFIADHHQGITFKIEDIRQVSTSITVMPPMETEQIACESRLRVIIIEQLMNMLGLNYITLNSGKLTDGYILSL